MNGESLTPNDLLVASFPLKGFAGGAGLPGTVVVINNATPEALTEPTALGLRGFLTGLRLVWSAAGTAAGTIEIYDNDPGTTGVLVASIVVGEAAPAAGKAIDIAFKTPRVTPAVNLSFWVKGYVNVGTVNITVDGYYHE
jgi:hypothetical protein